jgi:glycosyltransferase involved in cell wall biosynthesis
MRVLLTVHDFYPIWGGTEQYTYNVGQILRGNAHQVHVLHAEAGPGFGREERDVHGLPCTVVKKPLDNYENLFCEEDSRVDAIFSELLARFRPDVVHINHLVHLSSNIPRLCRARDVPVVFTLNDFWLHCARFTYLENNATLCTGPAPEKCAACCRSIHAAPPPNGSFRARLVRRLRRYLTLPSTTGTDDIDTAKKFRQRAAILADAIAHTDLFIAPSRFLLETMTRHGIPREKMACCDYGMSAEVRRADRPKRQSGRLRFGFVGTISRHKGAHVLLEAFDGITEAELHVYGAGDGSLRETYAHVIAQDHVRFQGELSSKNKNEAFALMDALIVPSVWYENSPLVIHEAYQAGVPVITSNHGGMAELVPSGVSGLQFQVGDAQDLRRAVLELCRRPEELGRLSEAIPHVKEMDEHYDELMGFYDRVRAAKTAWARA